MLFHNMIPLIVKKNIYILVIHKYYQKKTARITILAKVIEQPKKITG